MRRNRDVERVHESHVMSSWERKDLTQPFQGTVEIRFCQKCGVRQGRVGSLVHPEIELEKKCVML